MGALDYLLGTPNPETSSLVKVDSGNVMLNKILGLAAGLGGAAIAGGILIASIMSDKVRGVTSRLTGPNIQRVFQYVNTVFQIAEPWVRSSGFAPKESKMDHILGAIDQALDLAQLIIFSDRLGQLGRSRPVPYS